MMSHFECLKVKRRNLIGVTLYIYPPVFDFLNNTVNNEESNIRFF